MVVYSRIWNMASTKWPSSRFMVLTRNIRPTCGTGINPRINILSRMIHKLQTNPTQGVMFTMVNSVSLDTRSTGSTMYKPEHKGVSKSIKTYKYKGLMYMIHQGCINIWAPWYQEYRGYVRPFPIAGLLPTQVYHLSYLENPHYVWQVHFRQLGLEWSITT